MQFTWLTAAIFYSDFWRIKEFMLDNSDESHAIIVRKTDS